MDFVKRLGYFLVGLSLGIVFLTFFFKKKSEETGASFCYFPNCRTLKNIRSKSFVYAPEIKAQLEQGRLDTLSVKTFLTDGDVDFGASDTKSRPCKTYYIYGELKGKAARMTVKNCPREASLEAISYTEEN